MERLLNVKNILRGSELYIWIFNNLIFNFVFSYIDLLMFVCLFKINITKSDKIKFVTISGIVNVISKFIIISPYVRIINLLFTIVLFKLFFRNSIEKCILGGILNVMTTVCPEILFSKALSMIYTEVKTYSIGFYNVKYAFLLMSAIVITRLAILFFIKRKKIVLEIQEHLSYENKYTIITVSTISCLLIFLNVLEIDVHDTNFLYTVFVLNIISIVIYFCVSLKSIVKIAILEEQYNKIHTLESYNKTLSIMYDNIRGFKHNFSNFVQALDGYVKTNDIEGIRTMSEDILKDCISTNNLEILDPNIINNSAIYSLITNKYYLAQEQDIVMNIEVMVDLKEINISNYDLCQILAILLDNAIEAASKCEGEKIINVKLLNDLRVKRKLIIIENSYVDDNIDIDKLFEKGFSTKKDKKRDEHGLGLWSVRKILMHKDNLNLFTQKGELFLQQLEIYE